MNEKATILIAEDDDGHADLIRKNLTRSGIVNTILRFRDGQEISDFLFLRGNGPHREPGKPYILLLDIRMEGMTGTALFQLLRERGCTVPVIFLTGHGDVPLAVAALKHGAFDFFEKPCNDNQLVDRIAEALKHDETLRQAAASAESINHRLGQLSARERQVMERVLAGKLNKVIADELHVSMRTVEVHRSSLFEKMGVKTAVELAQILANNINKAGS